MLYTHLFLFLVMVVFAQAWKGRRSILIKPVYMQCSNRKMALAGHTLNGQEIDNDLHPISNFCLVKVKESLGETVSNPIIEIYTLQILLVDGVKIFSNFSKCKKLKTHFKGWGNFHSRQRQGKGHTRYRTRYWVWKVSSGHCQSHGYGSEGR